MDSVPYNNNANTNVYFLNAKINGPETVIKPHSTLPQSSTGNQIPVFLAASSSTGGQYAATLPQQANVSRQQTHEVLNEHKTHCACTDLPNTQNSAVGEVPVKLNSPNYSGPYATLPQPIQNFAGNIPVLLNVRQGQRQQFQTGSDPSSMMSMVDPNGVGGWYPAVNVVRTRVKESELQNMINWPIIPETEEVLDARPPQNSGNESTPRKSGKKKKKPLKEEKDEGEENVEEESHKENVKKRSCLHGLAVASCVFAMFMITLGFANLIVYIAFKTADKYPCSTFLALAITGSDTSPYIGFECGMGILTILIFITGILTLRIEDPLKAVPVSVAVLSTVSVIVVVVVWISQFTTFFSMFNSVGTPSSTPCLITLFLSFFVSLFGFVDFILSIILCTIVFVKRTQALQRQTAEPSKKKRVKKSKRNVVRALKKSTNGESNRKDMKQKNKESEDEDEDDEEDEEGKDEVDKNNNWGSEDDDSESAKESKIDSPTPTQTSTMKDVTRNTRTKHPSTPLPSSPPHPVPRPEIPCVPLGLIYAGYVTNPYNQAAMDNGYMLGRYQPFQYNGRVVFSPTQF